ncbi:nif11-like leader peptide domain protein [Synechococcus sp. BIOS-E4-1]|nr:nif11-like leader peptide domain protein [Synechococcus sp. BIOS-E4-1]
MSAEQIKAFLKKIKGDTKLQEKLKAAQIRAITPLTRAVAGIVAELKRSVDLALAVSALTRVRANCTEFLQPQASLYHNRHSCHRQQLPIPPRKVLTFLI